MNNVKNTAETVGAVAAATVAVLYLGYVAKIVVDLYREDKPKRLNKIKVVVL